MDIRESKGTRADGTAAVVAPPAPSSMSNLKEKTSLPEQRWIPKRNTGMMFAGFTRRRNRCATIESIERHRQSRIPSTIPSRGSISKAEEESASSFVLRGSDLDAHGNGLDSKSMLSRLGRSPSSLELSNVAAVRANEYINECLFGAASAEGVSTSSGVLDRQKWESIPQYAKSDLVICKYLGKGSFSDVFEVHVTVLTSEENKLNSSENEKLDRLVEAKLATKPINKDEEIDDDLGAQIDALFGNEATSKKVIDQEGNNRRKPRDCSQAPGRGLSSSFLLRPPKSDTASSTCVRRATPIKKRQVTYAMKCLRPKIRSNAEQFLGGVEDLVHETAMLSSLDHPNIIGLHGRAGSVGAAAEEILSNAFRLSDGYFILLDRMQDTLEDRIASWKKIAAGRGGSGESRGASPALGPFKTACSVADALAYLHSKSVVYRDLKPANVGYDSRGVVKLFDFGFAIGVNADGGSGELLFRSCGTQRYMAPENGLALGYSFPADVYSFGVLLWEIWSLKKPFACIKSPEEFRRSVFMKGQRPKLARSWPLVLKYTISGCWCGEPGKRPTMDTVATLLKAHIANLQQQNSAGSSGKSSLFQRRPG